MARPVQVLVVDQADQLRVMPAIIEIELDQAFDRGFGFEDRRVPVSARCRAGLRRRVPAPPDRGPACCRNNGRSSACWRANGGRSHRPCRPRALCARIRPAPRRGLLRGCGPDRGDAPSGRDFMRPCCMRGAVDRPTRPTLSFQVTTQLPRPFAVRRGYGLRAASTPGGDQHENLETCSCGRGSGGAQRVRRVRAAEDDVYAQLGRRRRSCAVLLRAEDGLVQRRRRQRRLRDRPRLGRLRPEGRGGRLAARSLRHGRRAAVPRQGLGSGRADEHLCQLAAGPLLAEELRHQVGQGSRRQEDRQPGGRRRPHACGRRWRRRSASIRTR